MNARIRQYLFSVVFLGFGLYQLYLKDFLEASLYSLAGLAFIFNTLAGEPRFVRNKKTLAIVTWILIGITATLFLYVIQFKYF